jgi:hypothetical protein
MQFSTWMTICLLWASSAALFGIPSSDSHGPPKGPWRALAVGLAIVAAMNVILALVAPDAEPREYWSCWDRSSRSDSRP